MSAHHTHSEPGRNNVLPVALGLTLSFAGIEAAAGWWAGSLALLGDAGHMLTDSLALALATLAARLARTPPSHRHSFGLVRIEVLAALVNAGFMLALVLGLSWNALARLAEPRPVAPNAPKPWASSTKISAPTARAASAISTSGATSPLMP